MSSTGAPSIRIETAALAKRLVGPAILAGVLGGLLMIVVMILVMGASGMGYASPLNLGMPAFVYTITPPPAMLPNLMAAMGIALPPATMAQVGPMLQSGHISPAMAHQLGNMLMAMHVPASKVQMMGALMTGHATNGTVSTLMSQMSPAARHAVMAAMPVSTGHVFVGTILHLAFAAFLGVAFFTVIVAAARLGLPALGTPTGLVAAGTLGGAVVYVVNRWVLLPPINPMMKLVPQLAFFFTHLLFGAAVGFVLARSLQGRTASAPVPAFA